MPVVFCPLCGFGLAGGLNPVAPHIREEHNICTSNPYPDGFRCRQPGCQQWYAVFKSWHRHIRDDHNGGLDAGPELLEGAVGAFRADDGDLEGEPDVIGGAEVAALDRDGNNLLNVGDMVALNDPDVGDGADADMHMDVDLLQDYEPPAVMQPVAAGDAASDHDSVGQNSNAENSSDGSVGIHNEPGDDENGSGSEDRSSDEMSVESRASDDSGSQSEEDGSDIEDEGNNIDLKHLAVDMVVKLRSHCTMNRTEVRLAMGGCDDILRGYSESVTAKVTQFLQRNNIEGNADAQELLASLQFNSPFNGIRSDKGQVSGTKEFYRYIDPVTLDLRGRVEPVNVGGGNFRLRLVRESAHYVSPKDILKLLYAKENVMDYVNNLEPRDDGFLTGYTDGDLFRTHPFFQRFPKAFQLVLYYDDFEVVCKKGTKCLIHTIAAFYLLVLNVPPYMNSALNSIHVVLLANYDDLKSLGFRRVLQPLDDLAALESPEGVPIVLTGQRHIMRGSLVAFIGDTKAAHEIFELLGPGARHFCRLCMISRNELHVGNVILAERRSRLLHEQHLQMIAENPGNSTLCGVKGNTCLHDLNHFRYWHNYAFDVFHDMTGIAHLIIRLVLRKFICLEGYFRAVDLNRRIRSFNYGVQDIKNRPSANLSHDKLRTALREHVRKQNGGQTFCLLRVLPFLLDGFVPNEDENPYLEILVLLQKIVELALAPKLHRTIIPYYYQVLEDYRRARTQLFPHVPLINKEHHKEHYPECTLMMGPLKVYWCMRCEGEHRPLRRHIISCNSYRDAAKTAIEFAQFSQASEWGTDSTTINVKVKVTSTVRDKRVDGLLTGNLLLQRGFQADDIMRTVVKVSVKGFDYDLNQFVVTRPASQNEHGMLSFGKISGIILADNDTSVWLEVEEWDTLGFDERLNAYVISPIINANVNLLDTDNLPLHPQLSTWNDYTTDRLYMCLKHLVV